MIWLSKIRTGETWGVNPTEIVTVEPTGMYMNPREDDPNRVPDPRTPEGQEPHIWYGNGSHVVIRNHPTDGQMVEQTPEQIAVLLEGHEERFVEAMEALRLARESQDPDDPYKR